MKTPMIPKTLLILFAACLMASPAKADEKNQAAVTAAKQWLAWVDAKEYKKSWEEAAPYFKANVKQQQWEEVAAAVRKPLGNVASRVLLSSEEKKSLPGAPDGEYVVIQFKTAFGNKRDSVETVTPMKSGETWRVSGYYIK